MEPQDDGFARQLDYRKRISLVAGLRLPSLEKRVLRALELWLPRLEPQRRSLFLHELLQEQLQFLEW